MARGYTVSQAVLTANEVGFFEALADGPRSLRGLARRLRCSLRGIRALADALTALGLIERDGERVWNGELARTLLISRGEEYIGHMLRHQKRLCDRWGQLERAVRTGRPVGRSSRGPTGRRRFLRAMVDASRPSVREVIRHLDLSGCRHLLDLGGGLGHYAIAFAEQWPHLKATLFDLPEAICLARDYMRQQGLEGKIECIAGDARRDRLGGPYDVIFTSNVLHIFPRREVVTILRRAARVLNPAGMLVIKEFALRSDRSGPLQAGLFALNMLVATDGGLVYTEAEYEEMLTRVGLRRTARHEVGTGSLLQVAQAR
jgi:ubiquinone/menaquinone biosynthesis C-methylase UbiE